MDFFNAQVGCWKCGMSVIIILAWISAAEANGEQPISIQSILKCYQGTNHLETNNLTAYTYALNYCSFYESKATCVRYTLTDAKSQAVVAETAQCEYPSINRTCDNTTQRLFPFPVSGNLTCVKTICSSDGCNAPTVVAPGCPTETKGDLQVLPDCTLKKNLTSGLKCLDPFLKGLPYSDVTQCRSSFNESLYCFRDYISACTAKGGCPMFWDKIPAFGTSIRLILQSLAVEPFGLESVGLVPGNSSATYDWACPASKERFSELISITIHNTTNVPEYQYPGENIQNLTAICGDLNSTTVAVMLLEHYRKLILASDHNTFCRIADGVRKVWLVLWKQKCNSTLLIATLAASGKAFESVEFLDSIKYLEEFFTNWPIPTCEVPPVYLHEFQQQIVATATASRVSRAALRPVDNATLEAAVATLTEAFRYSASSVRDVVILGVTYTGSNPTIRYYVSVSDKQVNGYQLLSSYVAFSKQGNLTQLSGLPKMPVCSLMTFGNLTFNATEPDETAYSNEKCQKGYSRGSIRCVTQEEKSVDYGNVLKVKFDINSLQTANCSLLLDDIPVKNVSAAAATLQLYTSSGSLSTTDTNKTLHILSAMTATLLAPNATISPSTMTAIVEIGDNIAQSIEAMGQDTSALQTYNAVAAINAGIRLVAMPANQTLAFRSKKIFGQISSVDVSTVKVMSYSPVITKGNETTQPMEIEVPIESKKNAKDDDTSRVSFLLFAGDALFPSSENVDWVTTCNVGKEVRRQNLDPPVQLHHDYITTRHGDKSASSLNELKLDFLKQRCVFWDVEKKTWSSKGCRLVTSSTPPTCRCDHLTSFALIVSKVEIPADAVLSVLSTIGCALSICGLAAVIILFLLNREFRKKEHNQIQLHMYVNLLLAYVIFLAGVTSTESDGGCTAIAAFLQFFFLATWMWTAVYSYKLYKSIVKVFSISTSHFMIKSCLIGYGMPLLTVTINLALTLGVVDKINLNEDYDPPSLDPEGSSYRRDSACWIQGYSLYFGFLFFVGAVLLGNVFVIVAVLRHVHNMKNKVQSSANNKKDKVRELKMAFTMSVTLGATWIVGFFMLFSEDPTYVLVFSWIFTAFNAIQGVLIFYVAAVMRKEIFEMWFSPLRRAGARFSGKGKSYPIFDTAANTNSSRSNASSGLVPQQSVTSSTMLQSYTKRSSLLADEKSAL